MRQSLTIAAAEPASLAREAALTLPGWLGDREIGALYVHIPFCFHKCHYCDFYSITRQTAGRMEQFVDRLLAEAGQWQNGSRGVSLRPKTVFFGGGTPTLLPLDAMRRLIRGLRRRFDFSQVCEWTIEANPATLNTEYARMLRDEGVDRLSFGAQSFDPAELKLLERHHDPSDVGRSIENARAAGFTRLNVDLIYAIPGQTLTSWAASLEEAVALGVDHVSCYNLTYESNTPMAVRKRLGHFQALSESAELEMFHFTRQRLQQAGFAAYEISNFARPGQDCRHNLVYWNGGDYLGFGPSAAAHVSGWRWKNRAHLGEWETAVDAVSLPAGDVEHLDPHQRAGELAMLQLRLCDGLRFDAFGSIGIDAAKVFARTLSELARQGLLDLTGSGARLTARGLEIADAIGGEFLAAVGHIE